MIKSKQSQLETLVLLALEYPENFFAGRCFGGIRLAQMLETIAAIQEWSWLSRDGLIDCIECCKNLSIVDGMVVGSKSKAESHPLVSEMRASSRDHQIGGVPLYFPDPNFTIDGYANDAMFESFPSESWLEQLRDRKLANFTERSVMFTSIDSALMVSWALAGNLDSAGVSVLPAGPTGRIVHEHPIARESKFIKLGDRDILVPVTTDILESRYTALRQSVWLSETLYLGDVGAHSLAAKKLFKTATQRDVEALLVPHLKADDSEVKCNVLNALGMPAYSVGFAPGASLPARAERLEPVLLASQTIESIIELARQEKDQSVLDAIVCTLSSQSFATSLRSVAEKVVETLNSLLPKFQSEQTTRDARMILRDIRRFT